MKQTRVGNTPDWVKTAVIMQPWGDAGDEDRYVREYPLYAKRLKDMGFNTICFIPPAGHNDIYKRHYNDAEFAKAVKGYQRAGIRALVYSCHLHVGHDPSWHDLVKQHPEWLFQDQHGKPVWFCGDYILCPNNEEAFRTTLNHTAKLVRQFRPDGIMMDNNFIYGTTERNFCYCEGCRKAFGAHIRKRYTAAEIKKRFRKDPRRITIPKKRSLLYEEWIDWQYLAVRDWAKKTRSRLRRIKPDCAVTANTAYGLGGTWTRGSDLQFGYQDSVFNENGVATYGLAFGARYARSLGRGKPVWLYLSTWKSLNEETSQSELLDGAAIQGGVASTLAHGATPWIVSYGIDLSTRLTPEVKAMERYLQFYRRHRKLYEGSESHAELAILVSRQTRDHSPVYRPRPDDIYRKALYSRVIQDHAFALTEMKIPYDIITERDLLEPQATAKYKTLLVPDAGCLSDRQVAALRRFVRSGGKLITTENTGVFDALGRRRARAPFRDMATQCRDRGREDAPLGKGSVSFLPFLAPPLTGNPNRGYLFATMGKEHFRVLVPRLEKVREKAGPAGEVLSVSNCPVYVEVNPTRQRVRGRWRYVLHVLNHSLSGQLKNVRVSLRTPPRFRARRVRLLSPDARTGEKEIRFQESEGRVNFTVPELKIYTLAVVE